MLDWSDALFLRIARGSFFFTGSATVLGAADVVGVSATLEVEVSMILVYVNRYWCTYLLSSNRGALPWIVLSPYGDSFPPRDLGAVFLAPGLDGMWRPLCHKPNSLRFSLEGHIKVQEQDNCVRLV